MGSTGRKINVPKTHARRKLDRKTQTFLLKLSFPGLWMTNEQKINYDQTKENNNRCLTS